jgi:hypothetical protein
VQKSVLKPVAQVFPWSLVDLLGLATLLVILNTALLMESLAVVALGFDAAIGCAFCASSNSSSSPNAKASQSWVDDITISSLISAKESAQSRQTKSVNGSRRSLRGTACRLPSRNSYLLLFRIMNLDRWAPYPFIGLPDRWHPPLV